MRVYREYIDGASTRPPYTRAATAVQVGWFHPGEQRFCYLDEKEAYPDQRIGFTQRVYRIEDEDA